MNVLEHRLTPTFGRGRVQRRPVVVVGAANKGANIPGSKQETLNQVVEALRGQLGEGSPKKKQQQQQKKKKNSKGSRGFSATVKGKRVAIEIPQRDDSDEGTAKLCLDLINLLGTDYTSRISLVCCGSVSSSTMDNMVKEVPDLEVLNLQEAVAEAPAGDIIILSAPGGEDVGALKEVEELLYKCRGATLVCATNPRWDDVDPPEEYRGMIRNFTVLYSFVPLSIQGLLGTLDGCVFKYAGGTGAPEAAAYRVFLTDADQESGYKQIGQMSRRPGPGDLETVIYNAQAAQSPITKAAKGISGLFGNRKSD